jgi:WD40 repeat protein
VADRAPATRSGSGYSSTPRSPGTSAGWATVACAVLDGRPVAVTGSCDDTVRVWDLPTGTPVGDPLTGHTSPVAVMRVFT